MKNPFSGVLDEEIQHIIVPTVDLNEIKTLIESDQNIIIEFQGKKGRGKSTHLRYLSYYYNWIPSFELNTDSSAQEILATKSDVIFLDSIHHLSFKERKRIFTEKRIVVYTTHRPRILSWRNINKKRIVYYFKGITSQKLEHIIQKRLVFNNKSDSGNFSYREKDLINKFGDNYRAILTQLYLDYNGK